MLRLRPGSLLQSSPSLSSRLLASSDSVILRLLRHSVTRYLSLELKNLTNAVELRRDFLEAVRCSQEEAVAIGFWSYLVSATNQKPRMLLDMVG